MSQELEDVWSRLLSQSRLVPTDRGVTSQLIGSRIGLPSTVPQLQESYNTPLEHTPGNPPTQLWKDSLYNLLVKV